MVGMAMLIKEKEQENHRKQFMFVLIWVKLQ